MLRKTIQSFCIEIDPNAQKRELFNYLFRFVSASKILFFLFCCILTPLSENLLHAQSSNLGFELGNFSNWTGYSWIYSTDIPSATTSPVQGIVYRRHTIMSDTSAYDVNTGYALKTIPKGYKYSARLGDGFTSADKSFRCWEQSLRYTITIDSSNALLVMKFACVLQYAKNHSEPMEARFRLSLYDAKGNLIPDCSNYDVFASNAYVKGFNTFIPTGSSTPVKWRDWTTVGANLSKYIGQTITIEFMSADCTGHFHYGYAYFVAESHPLDITVKYCAGDSVAVLTAPEGFEKFKWTDKNGKSVDSTQTIKVKKPTGGESFSCTMTSATGCVVTLQSTIAKYLPKASFTSYMIDCFSNIVQFVNTSTHTIGALQYKWDFGDGKTSTEKNPRYKFSTSGLHPMSLTLKNPPSTCVDTLKKVVESFSPPLVGITGDSTYCPNQSTFLKAYGAYEYTWSNGSKADSIEVSAPGGLYWLIGKSSTGCVSYVNYRNVIEDPAWELKSTSDTTLCTGFNTTLQVGGAKSYLWNTGDTSRSITVNIPGKYDVTGTNKRGCIKFRAFTVKEYPIPLAGFTTSVNTLDWKHNQITCSIVPQSDVLNAWDMGDGTVKAGSTIQHTYEISPTILQYTIVQKATSIYGCSDSTFKVIDVAPFVPNVFSPNGDGINDVFMADIELQVCDRNGLVVYRGTSGWDGKYNGKLMEPDTYFYVIRYLDRNQKEQTRKGYVTLVR